MKHTELRIIEQISDNIIEQTKLNSIHLVYVIQMAEKMLRPYQMKKLKFLVVEALRKQYAQII